MGVQTAERVSPPKTAAPGLVGREFAEDMLRVNPGKWFSEQQALREFIFQQGLEASAAGSNAGSLVVTEGRLLPAQFLLKVVREDGGMVEVEFMLPQELEGDRGWIRATDLADSSEKRQSD
ncbi:MAG: hypothetical protein AAGJ79_15075 [Verrucomicrobiota bacterium]